MNTPGSSSIICSDEYDPRSDESLAIRVVRAVAVASDQNPTDLAPLIETTDVDAIETLLESWMTDIDASLEVAFEYDGYLVHIDTQGTITLHENPG